MNPLESRLYDIEIANNLLCFSPGPTFTTRDLQKLRSPRFVQLLSKYDKSDDSPRMASLKAALMQLEAKEPSMGMGPEQTAIELLDHLIKTYLARDNVKIGEDPIIKFGLGGFPRELHERLGKAGGYVKSIRPEVVEIECSPTFEQQWSHLSGEYAELTPYFRLQLDKGRPIPFVKNSETIHHTNDQSNFLTKWLRMNIFDWLF